MGKAEALRTALIHTGDALLSSLFAPACACCHATLDAPLRGPVCGRCWEELRALDGEYKGALRQAIHAFKYEGRRSLAQPLGAGRALGTPSMLCEFERAGFVLDEAHCAVPVPLFPWRRIRRGFNQASELARHLGIPVVHALWRVRVTATQTGLTKSERHRNVSGAFRVSPLLSDRSRAQFITGRIVVLVDDVRTTGATANACVEVLLAAGAEEVRVATLARAPLR